MIEAFLYIARGKGVRNGKMGLIRLDGSAEDNGSECSCSQTQHTQMPMIPKEQKPLLIQSMGLGLSECNPYGSGLTFLMSSF
jgi:hypothetical protein